MLNLNHPGIRDRRKRLARSLSRGIARARRYWADFLAETQPGAAEFEEACEDVKLAMEDHSELAASARAYVRALRGSDRVVEELLEAVS